MAPPPTRQALEAMKRSDLQKLCKDYGLKANLKSDALIDMILETGKPNVRAQSVQQDRKRSVSTRHSSRTNSGRVSSFIIHDLEEDEEEEEEEEADETGAEEQENQSEQEPEPTPPPAPRTRKAKETQFRLGVGKPVIAGGSGPRSVTKSLSVSRGKRGKGSKSLKPVEATIPEEEPENISATNSGNGHESSQEKVVAEPDPQPAPAPILPTTNDNSAVDAALADINKRIAEAIAPLQMQIQTLKTELEKMQSLRTELDARTSEFGTLQQKVETLTAEVQDLRSRSPPPRTIDPEDQLKQFKASYLTEDSPETETQTSRMIDHSTPRLKDSALKKAVGRGNLGIASSLHFASPSLPWQSTPSSSQLPRISTPPHPGIAPSMLGKRHRESTDSITGVVEDGEQLQSLSEPELARQVLRPSKKRPRIGGESESDHPEGATDGAVVASPEAEADTEAMDDVEAPHTPPRAPSFTVYTGPDPSESYNEPPPPTNPLPDFYEPSSPSGAGPSRPAGNTQTQTQNAVENHPFGGFNFLPIPPSPAPSLFNLPNFPYPEPPQSPTPTPTHQHTGNNHNTGFLGSSEPRTDMFQAFGMPSPARSARASLAAAATHGIMGGGFVNPAQLSSSRRPSDREREDGRGDSATGADAPAKRTMYGTELEGDTRFGDFGVEGVASGFWTGGRF